MGVIGKDFKYKIIKNFITLEEQKLLSHYCEIQHRLNYNNFDGKQNNNFDTSFYADKAMESLMLSKLNIMEKETGKKLLPTYAFYRTYTKLATLEKHTDRESCEISVTVHINGDGTDWPIFMDGVPLHLDKGDAGIYLGCEIPHWREEFKGDYQHQAFLHYVDKEGPNKQHYMDQRRYFGIVKDQ